MKRRVLIACEYSGVVREAFAAKGWDAWSCDLDDTDQPGQHIIWDAVETAYDKKWKWDLMICHPPCTFLTTSGAKWFYHPDDSHLPFELRRPHPLYPNRRQDREAGLEFVKRLLNAPVPFICLENPIGIISTRIRKPDQIIQPYEFGHDAAKATCLWLKNLPLLRTTKRIPPRITAEGYERWANQVDASGANCLPPSANRGKLRSKTYQGVADAMADQWTAYFDFNPVLP